MSYLVLFYRETVYDAKTVVAQWPSEAFTVGFKTLSLFENFLLHNKFIATYNCHGYL